MKYINNFKTFENNYGFAAFDSENIDSPFIKNYGESYDWSQVIPGVIITYKGTDYYVISNDGKYMQLSTSPETEPVNNNEFVESTGNRIIDKNEFDNKVCIRKD